MDSFILEDVNSLLKLKKGDSSRLNHIKELCEANEIISLSDRKYIERLSSQYLQKHEKAQQKKQDKPKFIPIEEQTETAQIGSTETAQIQSNDSVEPVIQIEEDKTRKMDSVISFAKNLDFSGHKNIIFATAAIILAIILITIVAVEYDGIQLISNDSPPANNVPDLPFVLESDKSSYETSDIISISGKIASPLGETIRVSIENEQGKLIWAENLDLKNNGEFSTLAIAGGDGWENNGEYTLKAEHEGLIEETSFDFDSLK